jgi:hypothetical protein
MYAYVQQEAEETSGQGGPMIRSGHHPPLDVPPRACCGPAERTPYRAVDHTDDRCETRVDHPAGARCRYTVFRLTPSALAMASTVCSFTACRR